MNRILNYKEWRDILRDGDVVMYSGSGFFSWLIKKITRSNYSHAGIVVWWNNRLMVLEAISKGIVVTPLSENISHYHGDVDLFCHMNLVDKWDKQHAAIRTQISIHAQLQLGKKYNRWRMIVYAWRLLYRTPFDKRDAFRKSSKMYCSYYVASCYNAAGLDIVPGLADSYTTPGDIVKSRKITKMGILKHKGIY